MNKKKNKEHYDHISRASFMKPILDKMLEYQKATKKALEHDYSQEVDKPAKGE